MRAQITAILQLRACTSFSPLDSVVPNPNRTQGKEFRLSRRPVSLMHILIAPVPRAQSSAHWSLSPKRLAPFGITGKRGQYLKAKAGAVLAPFHRNKSLVVPF